MKFFPYMSYIKLKITNSPFSGVGRNMKLGVVVKYTSTMVTGKKNI